MAQYLVYFRKPGVPQRCIIHIDVNSCFDALVKISELYVANQLTERDYLNNLREAFRDDNGEDWLDDNTNFQRLANSLIDGE